jgi:TatA/E family protein of Tat protein translocase
MGIDNPVHLIFIAAVALIVLGPKRLPDLARSLGQGMREFRDSMSEAVKDEGPVSGSLVPEQPQLVAASEALPATPADAVVVDPAAPAQAVPVQATPAQAVPVQSAPVQVAPVQSAPVQAATAQAVPVQVEAATVQVDATQAVAQPAPPAPS